jgi:hypothetical protein
LGFLRFLELFGSTVIFLGIYDFFEKYSMRIFHCEKREYGSVSMEKFVKTSAKLLYSRFINKKSQKFDTYSKVNPKA